MNDIILSIQQDILNSSISLASILLKAKVLAYQLKNEEFKNWVKNELDGYAKDEELPGYRILRANSIGTFFNGVYQHNNQPIPSYMIPEEFRAYAVVVRIHEGIRSLEEMAVKEQLQSPWSGDWIAYFNNYNSTRLNTYHLTQAHRPVMGSTFAQIIETVRSRLQDLILEISDLPWQVGKGLPPADQIEKLVQVTIYNNSQGGNMSTFDQREQHVQNQYNAARDINIGAIQNSADFLDQLQHLKSEISRAGESKILDEDLVVDAEYEITKVIQEVKKPEPKKDNILSHMNKAKSLVEGVTATAGLATALVKLIEVAHKLF